MAAKQTHLRAVKPEEKAAKAKPMSVTAAAAAGDHRALLVAMRDRVAKDVENPNTSTRDLAALTRRLMEISKEIEAIDVRSAEEGDSDDPLDDEEWDASAI